VTIVEVAEHAGVSRSAVSKVLRNAKGVSTGMRERVRSSMAELGYRPHAGARGMRGKTYTIGVVLDTIHNPFFAEILDGIQDVLSTTDYEPLLGAGGYSSAGQTHVIEAMIDRRMDGLILIGPGARRTSVTRTARSTPTVVVGHHDTGKLYDSVIHDDAAGAACAVDHLVARGHRRIALMSTAGVTSGWVRRPEVVLEQSYRESMIRQGLIETINIVRTTYSEAGGYKAGIELLSRPERPTAIFAGTDIAALGVFRAAAELGLRIPDDLSLVGYNNTALADLDPVQLSSVDQAGHQMGRAAATLLLERIDGRTRPSVFSTTPHLVVRRTSGETVEPVSSRGLIRGAPEIRSAESTDLSSGA
jgi:LacI family transcriptional regulator